MIVFEETLQQKVIAGWGLLDWSGLREGQPQPAARDSADGLQLLERKISTNTAFSGIYLPYYMSVCFPYLQGRSGRKQCLSHQGQLAHPPPVHGGGVDEIVLMVVYGWYKGT